MRFLPVILLIAILILILIGGFFNSKMGGFLLTHENYLTQLADKIDINDADLVFGKIFNNLSDEIIVYPTENYYYFKFVANGKEFWGNIRLAVGDRDRGLLSFAYWEFNNMPEVSSDSRYFSKHKEFSEVDGLKINKIDPLKYEVVYRGKKVRFILNDVPQSAPRFITRQESEEFVMRTFDESGFYFLLYFNKLNNKFTWVLDEERLMTDEFVDIGDDFLFGKRTQFIFYNDNSNNRKILTGVYAENVRRNNYFDGPFDQLADNFINNNDFAGYLRKSYLLKRDINKYGFYMEGGAPTHSRVAITPYYRYFSREDFKSFSSECRKRPSADLVLCLTDN